MKPLKSEIHDTNALLELGRASVQIVHDLKNQLNGLKLYATFLRKRMEKSERPRDELETISKLIAGLERVATDMTMLVRLGRPVELRRQPHVDLKRIVNHALNGSGAHEAVNAQTGKSVYEGEFDLAALAEALKAIHEGALNRRRTPDDEKSYEMQMWRDDSRGNAPQAVIEWLGITTGHDPFHSLVGSDGLRLSLAAKVIEAHGGQIEQSANSWRVRLPLHVTS